MRTVAFAENDNVLDMCCGSGNTTFAIARRVNPTVCITGIDLSHGQIKTANKNNTYANINFQVMDARETTFLDATFHKVIIPHALHEMERKLRLEVLREALRVLKSGGAVMVLEMDRPPRFTTRLLIGFMWFYWLPFNFETPTRRDMLRHGLPGELRLAGFTGVKKSNAFDGVFQVVQGIKP